nr:hypothetical protein BaRGS_019778 [Batillaria attramentaria]
MSDNAFTLFYGKFRANAPRVKPLTEQLELRLDKGPDAMLERLCTHLYDVLRPLIIHIQHLETLAELCGILKIEMMEEHVSQNPQELGAFEAICRQMLQDVQERLVYRTYIYIRTDILQYNAAPGDLAYPEKLEMMEGPLDGQLFLIKHLLILREQIAPFQADFSIRETHLDFSKIKDAAYGLLQKKSQLFVLNSNNALLQFVLEGTPQVTEMFIDSKRDVDQQLKTTCEDFISHVTQQFTAPLQTFLSRANVVVTMKKDDGTQRVVLRTQPFATPEKVHDVAMETYRNIKTRLAGVQRSMSLYLANRDTEAILFRPIKLLLDHYTEEDRLIVACPSSEQINLLLAPTSLRQSLS